VLIGSSVTFAVGLLVSVMLSPGNKIN